MRNLFIFMIVLLPFIIGLVVLQINLSKKRNKWLGLVLPFICFLFSILTISNMYLFSTVKTVTVTETTSITETTSTNESMENGTVIESEAIGPQQLKPSVGEMLLSVVPVFIITNIPTIIFITIYFSCREKLKNNKELEKMNIQDLD